MRAHARTHADTFSQYIQMMLKLCVHINLISPPMDGMSNN